MSSFPNKSDCCFSTNCSFSPYPFLQPPRYEKRKVLNILNPIFSLLPASTQSRANLLLSQTLLQITEHKSTSLFLNLLSEMSYLGPWCTVLLTVVLIKLGIDQRRQMGSKGKNTSCVKQIGLNPVNIGKTDGRILYMEYYALNCI